MTNIHIGNLSFNTTEEGLKSAFEQFGQVESARIIMDKMTGTSKGFGFVEMSDDEKAKDAIKKLNGSLLEGRKIRVSAALSREERDDGNPDRRNRGNGNRQGGNRDSRDSRDSRDGGRSGDRNGRSKGKTLGRGDNFRIW